MRLLTQLDETQTRSHAHVSQPVAGKCWAFVPKGKKGTIVFSGNKSARLVVPRHSDPAGEMTPGEKMPPCEGRYRVNYVLEGDPWSEQTIALLGPEFYIEEKHGGAAPTVT